MSDLTASSTNQEVLDHATLLKTELQGLIPLIQSGFDKEKGSKYSSSADYEITSLKQQEATFDTEFEESEAILQKTGGKSRRQTLQEFVLLFFFISFGIFIISVAILKFVETRQPVEAVKIVGILLLLFVVSIALIIRLG